MIEVDSFYLPASFKTQSQDYAMHGDLEGRFVYVIGADGCSSAERADVGSRLLTHNFAAAMHSYSNRRLWFRDGLGREARRELVSCGLKAADMTAQQIRSWDGKLSDYLSTLVCALYDKTTGGCWVMMLGDGAALISSVREGDRYQRWASHAYSRDMPCYPLYAVHSGLMRQYIEESNALGQIEASVEESRDNVDGNFDWVENSCFPSKPDGFYEGACHFYLLEQGWSHTITIFSDGAEKFHSGPTDSTDLMCAREAGLFLSDFPVRKGEFVKRRLLKRVRGQHYLGDDLFVAGITIDP